MEGGARRHTNDGQKEINRVEALVAVVDSELESFVEAVVVPAVDVVVLVGREQTTNSVKQSSHLPKKSHVHVTQCHFRLLPSHVSAHKRDASAAR